MTWAYGSSRHISVFFNDGEKPAKGDVSLIYRTSKLGCIFRFSDL